MILQCPNCETRYEIPVDLPPEGLKVRCSFCHHVWQATPENQPKPEVFSPDSEHGSSSFRDEPAGEAAAEETAAGEAGAAPVESSPAGKDALSGESVMAEAHSGGTDEPAGEGTAMPPGDGTEDRETAKTGSGELVPARESQPIVIGMAKKRSGGLPAPVAAGWAALALLVAGITAYAYFQRVEVVRAFPGAAAVYERLGIPVNIRGLAFDRVGYSWGTNGGREVLEVHGEILNVSSRPIKVPTVVFGLRTEDKVEVFQWATDVRSDVLPPHERTAFSAQIPRPPKSTRDVLVRFAKVR